MPCTHPESLASASDRLFLPLGPWRGILPLSRGPDTPALTTCSSRPGDPAGSKAHHWSAGLSVLGAHLRLRLCRVRNELSAAARGYSVLPLPAQGTPLSPPATPLVGPLGLWGPPCFTPDPHWPLASKAVAMGPVTGLQEGKLGTRLKARQGARGIHGPPASVSLPGRSRESHVSGGCS